MKVLLDTCVWGGIRQALSDAGHDVIWTGDWDADPGDNEIFTQRYDLGSWIVAQIVDGLEVQRPPTGMRPGIIHLYPDSDGATADGGEGRHPAVQQAMASGQPCHTRLDPPPADSRVSHDREPPEWAEGPATNRKANTRMSSQQLIAVNDKSKSTAHNWGIV